MTFSLAVKAQKSNVFMDDVDVTIVSAKIVDNFDYNGQQPPVTAAALEFQADGADESFVQHYTVGNSLMPTKNGLGLAPIPGKSTEGLGENTKLGKFLASLVSCGFPDAELEKNDISVLEGLHVHLLGVTEAQSEKDKKAGRKPTTVLLVNAIHEEAAATDKPNGKPGKATQPTAANKAKAKADPIREATGELIVELLEANDGKIPAAKLSTLLFKAAKAKELDLKTVKAVVALGQEEEYLAADDVPFDFDGTTLVSKEAE